MSTTPDRQAVEKIAGQPLQDWQWYAFLTLLHLPTGTPAIVAPVLDVPAGPAPVKKKSRRLQDSVTYTCERCGREGTRRFVQTATGWRCAPSSAETCARKARERASDSCAKPEPVQVTAAPTVDLDAPPKPDLTEVPADVLERRYSAGEKAEKVERAAEGPPITARCQDCTRTFTLTGRPLIMACDMHEVKHGHIVDVVEKAEAG